MFWFQLVRLKIEDGNSLVFLQKLWKLNNIIQKKNLIRKSKCSPVFKIIQLEAEQFQVCLYIVQRLLYTFKFRITWPTTLPHTSKSIRAQSSSCGVCKEQVSRDSGKLAWIYSSQPACAVSSSLAVYQVYQDCLQSKKFFPNSLNTPKLSSVSAVIISSQREQGCFLKPPLKIL